jgi:hypothetical protein
MSRPAVFLAVAATLAAGFPVVAASPERAVGATPPVSVAPGAWVYAAPAAGTVRFEGGVDEVTLPIDPRGSLIYLRGRVNDSDSLWIVLDSGASGDAINASVADALKLAVTGGGHARGAGGEVAAGVVAGATVKLPGVSIDGALGTLPLDEFGARSGRPMQVILGQPLLSRCVAIIDYAARTLTLRDPATFRYAGHGAVLPLTFEHGLPYVTAKLTLPGRAPISGRFVLDTGSGNALILAPDFVRREKVLEAVPRTIEIRGRGVGGQVQSRLGRLDRLEISDLRIDQPLATLRVVDVGVIAASGAIGNIGGEILRRFTVTFDYPRSRVILEPNAHFGEPFEGDMSGLGLVETPRDSSALAVDWIQPASPAAALGIQPDDLIEAVDGIPAATVGLPALREMFRRAGATHRLAVRRGDKRFEVALTTQRMI